MYPSDIVGLTFVAMAHDADRLRAGLAPTTTREVIEQLVRGLPDDFRLGFYDPYHPSPSDPGAFVSVTRTKGVYSYDVGNHGWSSQRISTSPELMIEYLLMVRATNTDVARGECIEVCVHRRRDTRDRMSTR